MPSDHFARITPKYPPARPQRIVFPSENQAQPLTRPSQSLSTYGSFAPIIAPQNGRYEIGQRLLTRRIRGAVRAKVDSDERCPPLHEAPRSENEAEGVSFYEIALEQGGFMIESEAIFGIAIVGLDWLHAPTLAPALGVGLGTIVAPWFVMQPAMGAGLAGSRTPDPRATRLRNLGTHTVYGIGLYLAAVTLARVWVS